MITRTVDSDRIAEFADAVVRAASAGEQGVPGVVAGVTTDKETVYLGHSGVRALDEPDPMTDDTVFAIFSTTKAIAGTAVLQLVESGDLDLDAPAREYEPRLGDVAVIEGFDDRGQPRLRAPRSEITTRHLLTHTAGFAYDFFDEVYARLAAEHGQPSIVTSTMASLQTPLLFDPGTAWEYGTNIDWAGLVVERIAGKRLGEVITERILAPLGMSDTAFTRTDSMRERTATIHHRAADGSLAPDHDFTLPDEPEVHMGGHGLYSTVGDYLKFIRMWLADGRADSGEPILSPATVDLAARNHLPGSMKITRLPGVIPSLSNDAEFFPGMPKSWALTFMINEHDAPTGRPAGSLAWAGLANLYYWIDRQNRIGGYWATQILPFADAGSVGGYLDFETAVYASLQR
ncbi:serine hydrolase domain-containing protein [Gordonia sp. SMJS1]|uniref:serine hydrolase domain-containing protein n=1 Tax=Gordonia sp. SMJS1 TaxID=3039400 RepID=UPI002456D883|nr:serine hydrolase domain-containing protein [Gordonia sp. SMJS1]WGJ87610.1 serine hydrolase [Gordonia sp. SMJS1]